VGGLAGYVYASSSGSTLISNCYVIGKVSGANTVGGLAAYNGYYSKINSCYVDVIVNGYDHVGGLVGYNSGGTIEHCYAKGKVNGTNNNVGGLVGWNTAWAWPIAFCYTTNTVSGNDHVGGLVGGNSDSHIRCCIAANDTIKARASSTARINRIAGHSELNSNYNSNYALNTILLTTTSAPIIIKTDDDTVNGTSKTLTELQKFSFYMNRNNWLYTTYGWNITSSTSPWSMCHGERLPFFRWENITCTNTFVSVTNITGVPTVATVNIPLVLNGTVEPSNATSQTIVWSILDTGGTFATLNGNMLTAAAVGTIIVTATIADGNPNGANYIQNCTITVGTDIPVTNIIGVPSVATVNVPLALTATVEPSDATNQTIVWTIFDVGTTLATLNGDTFTAAAAGTVVVTATIADGIIIGTPYTQDFSITVNVIPVTSITGVPTTAIINILLMLTGTVEPSNATNQTISWSISTNDNGTTSSSINGNMLTAAATGAVTVTATITDGLAIGTPYTRDFSLMVNIVGIVETDYNASVRVYPNPAFTYLHVKFDSQELADYNIYSITGQIILQGKIKDNSPINIESLAKGMYFLKIAGKTVKFVKE
jgi:uncharacterized protein YjdB